MILKDVAILEWTEDLSGSMCAQILGALGATVIKIERPGEGDPTRREGAVWGESDYPGSPLFGYLNSSKRSVTLDPARPSGWPLFSKLAGRCNLLVETCLGQLDGGRALERLRAEHPNLVIVSLSPYGSAGPLADVPHSPLTLQHRSGYAYHQARPVTDIDDQPPVGCVDHEGQLAFGVSAGISCLWGLLVARTAGTSPHIDLASYDFYAAHLSPDPIAEWSEGEREFARGRTDGSGAEVAGGLVWLVQCSDGWLMVSPREQHQWIRWMEVLGNPPWADDTALCGDRAARRNNYIQLQQIMSEWTSKRSRNDIFEMARKARVACFPVSRAADLLNNPQLIYREFFNHLSSETGRTVSVPGLPFTFTAPQGTLPRGYTVSSPALGEGNVHVFEELLGLKPHDLEQLYSAGVI